MLYVTLALYNIYFRPRFPGEAPVRLLKAFNLSRIASDAQFRLNINIIKLELLSYLFKLLEDRKVKIFRVSQ